VLQRIPEKSANDNPMF
jgi:hypothetical protein